MDWYRTIKDFYDSGFYDKEKVKVFVQKGKILETDYEKITGEKYSS